MDATEAVLAQIADNLDNRRLEITSLRRVALDYVGKPLEGTAVRMTVPVLYAHWEGYVKETCQLYIEHIEATVAYARQLQPALLGYLWTPLLRPITGGLNFDHRRTVAEHAVAVARRSVAFGETEKVVNTQSNLKFSALRRIADDLCLDISSLESQEHKLNALVHVRNNIAHGDNPRGLSYTNFEEYAKLVVGLMEEFERILDHSIRSRQFCRSRSRKRR